MVNIHIHKFQVGDRVNWNRYGDIAKASIIGINYETGKANLKVDGWVGTTWEIIDYNFSIIEPT